MQLPAATLFQNTETVSHYGEHGLITSRVNRKLNRMASANMADESSLVECFEQLYHASKPWEDNHWLTLIRLTELALWSAGRYADAGRFREVGDLMFNPRRKVLYIKGRGAPLELARHTPITRQVRHLAPRGMNLKEWLKRETMLRQEESALLPGLVSLLKTWPDLDKGYLSDVDARMRRVASTLCFHFCAEPPGDQVKEPDCLGLNCSQKTGMRRDKSRPHGNLCRFDLVKFHSLGREMSGKETGPIDYF